MTRAILPFIVLSVLVFTPPTGSDALAIGYLAISSFLFFFFMTMYVTPFFALLSELGHTPDERLQISTLISITWALGFMTGSQVYALQGALESVFPPVAAFRLSLSVFAALSLLLMALPLVFIDERRYSDHHPSSEGSFEAVKTAFTNPDFRAFALSDLTYWLALTFVQTGISFYVILLLGLPKEQASTMLLILFVASFLFYVPISLVARRTGKKPLLTAAFVLFIGTNVLMVFWGLLPGSPFAQGVAIMVLAALPLATFGILPNAIVGDIAEDDSIRTGNHKGAVYFGARTFMQKVGVAITVFVFPILSRIGGEPGQVGTTGVRITLAASALGLTIGMLLFLRYRERALLTRLRADAGDM
jgi:Na+/melibiose symporter-like transporter